MAALPRNSPVIRPHVHVPCNALNKYLPFLKKDRLNLEIYFGSRNFDDLTKNDIARLKNMLDYGPELSIHAPFMDLSPGAIDEKVREVTLNRFSVVMDFAEILGPKVIVFHSGYDKWKYDNRMDIWLEASMQTWRQINRRAEEIGVKIAIENIFEDEPENLRALAAEMNSANFGLCFDTGHFNLFSKLTLIKWLDIVKPYIVELHLHDNSKYADQHLAIGDGDFDFKALFHELRGTDCVYTLEAHTIEDVKKSIAKLSSLL